MIEDEYQFDPALRALFIPHMLKHAVGVLLGGGHVAHAERLLLDWRFLEARARCGEVFELLEDFAQAAMRLKSTPETASRALNLELLAEAVRRNARFIMANARQHPQTLFQCLWNTCWWWSSPRLDATRAARNLGHQRPAFL